MHTAARTRDRDHTVPPTIVAERAVERKPSKRFAVLASLETFMGQIESVVPETGLRGRSGIYTATQLEGQVNQAMPKLREALRVVNPTKLADEKDRQAIALSLLNKEAVGVTSAEGLRAAVVETAINERLGNRVEPSISDTVVMRREPREQRERRLQPFAQATSMREVLGEVKKLYAAREVIYSADDIPLTQDQVQTRLLGVVKVLDANFRSAELGQQLPEAAVNNLLQGVNERGQVQGADIPTDLGLRQNVARIITATYRLHPLPEGVLLSPSRMKAEQARRQNLSVPSAEPSWPERRLQGPSELIVHYPERPVAAVSTPAEVARATEDKKPEPTREVPRREVIKLQNAINKYVKEYLTHALRGPKAFSRDGILTTSQAMLVSSELRNNLDKTYGEYIDDLCRNYGAATVDLTLGRFQLSIKDEPTANQKRFGSWISSAADIFSQKWGDASEQAFNLRPRDLGYTVSWDATEKDFRVAVDK